MKKKPSLKIRKNKEPEIFENVYTPTPPHPKVCGSHQTYLKKIQNRKLMELQVYNTLPAQIYILSTLKFRTYNFFLHISLYGRNQWGWENTSGIFTLYSLGFLYHLYFLCFDGY